MAIFKEILPSDIKSQKTSINQIIDIIQSDISGSSLDNTRRKYQVFATGGAGSPGLTSSLYQTVYDQDYTLQTSNPMVDITFGLYHDSDIVTNCMLGVDSTGKELFPSQSLMMREKMDIYRQFAAGLLGSADEQFVAKFDSTSANDKIDAALFFNFKRLFYRDKIKPDTFAMKMYKSSSFTSVAIDTPNINKTSESNARLYTDVSVDSNRVFTYGGQVGNIVNAANTAESVGLVFYDRGVIVLDIEKVMSGSDVISGSIRAINSAGNIVLSPVVGGSYSPEQKVIPDLVVSASIDDILDHVCGTRFSSGSSDAAMTFQNITGINSTLVFCRAGVDEFNYSSNPTYIDEENIIRVIEDEETDQAFSYITSIGLYDVNDNLLAVAKLSRPVKKDPAQDLTFKIRLDF
jgi:hypothetical protein